MLDREATRFQLKMSLLPLTPADHEGCSISPKDILTKRKNRQQLPWQAREDGHEHPKVKAIYNSCMRHYPL